MSTSAPNPTFDPHAHIGRRVRLHAGRFIDHEAIIASYEPDRIELGGTQHHCYSVRLLDQTQHPHRLFYRLVDLEILPA